MFTKTQSFYFPFRKTKIGKDIQVKVQGNGEIEEFYSLVIGRTGIVHQAKIEDFTRDTNSDHFTKTFAIKTNNWMAPKSHLIVYYIHISGEIVYDRRELAFDLPLSNKVSRFI